MFQGRIYVFYPQGSINGPILLFISRYRNVKPGPYVLIDPILSSLIIEFCRYVGMKGAWTSLFDGWDG